MKIAWLSFFALGLATVVAGSGCEVTTSDGGFGGRNDEEGGRNTGGAATGGKPSTGGATATGGTTSTGGAKATGGAPATGGSTATGGEPPIVAECSGEGTPAGSCEFEPGDLPSLANSNCVSCLAKTATCCTALKKCYATDPYNACGYGGPEPLETEYLCFQNCVLDAVMEEGGYDETTEGDCAADCSATCNGIISDATNDVVTCMHDFCETECFEL